MNTFPFDAPVEQRPKWPYECWTTDDDDEEEEYLGEIEETQAESVEVTETHMSSETEVKSLRTEKYTENMTKTLSQVNNITGAPIDKTNNDATYNNEFEFDHCLSPIGATASEPCLSEDPTEDEEDVHTPCHWTVELEADISESCPINILVRATALPNASESAEAQQMNNVLMPMLEVTLKKLTASNKLFQDSRLLLVGSMAENTKVGKADEFDFAVILPVLAQKDCFKLLFNKADDYVKNPAVLSLFGDICGGNMEEVADYIQQLLKMLWCKQMMEHVPAGWGVLNPLGHSNASSVALTFHLQQGRDNTSVDLDLCFWIPLDKDSLLTSKLSQRRYVSKHCLDEHGFVYVVLPQYISDLRPIRFAMSGLEKYALNKYGADNDRIQCYRTCKCLISTLLPNMKKIKDCDHCFDGLVSSYCLKNIILYMAAHHTDDAYWTREKLPNRVVEVFLILTRCMRYNVFQASTFFTPNQHTFDSFQGYDPYTKCVYKLNGLLSCYLPDLTKIKEQFTEDPVSQTAIGDYEQFLCSTRWKYPEVICRMTELLTKLMQEDK